MEFSSRDSTVLWQHDETVWVPDPHSAVRTDERAVLVNSASLSGSLLCASPTRQTQTADGLYVVEHDNTNSRCVSLHMTINATTYTSLDTSRIIKSRLCWPLFVTFTYVYRYLLRILLVIEAESSLSTTWSSATRCSGACSVTVPPREKSFDSVMNAFYAFDVSDKSCF